MKFKDLLEVTGAGEVLHIGTEHGQGWLMSDTTSLFRKADFTEIKDRNVINIYCHGGREASSTCVALSSGIAVIIEGDEDGLI